MYLFTAGVTIIGLHIPILATLVNIFVTNPNDKFLFTMVSYIILIGGPILVGTLSNRD